MRRLLIHIDRVNWDVILYVDTTCQDARRVMCDLYAIGCDGEDAITGIENLSTCAPDNGVTYSSASRSASVMVIGRVSSVSELANTFVHECIHLANHIVEATNMDASAEPIAYAMGEFAKEAFARLFGN